MATRAYVGRIRIKWMVTFLLLSACIDPIYFEVPAAQSYIVVDGMISDDPGPYGIRLSRSLELTSDTTSVKPYTGAKITLHDDEGNAEDLTGNGFGIYTTGGVIQGQVGHSYYITIETPEGKIFESEPDKINPVGEVEQIRHEYEARTIERSYGSVDANVFNIFIDANTVASDEHYVRWRYTGTFKVNTFPEYHSIFSEGSSYADPLPCSGQIITPALGGGKLVKVGECTCCICYVNQTESLPHLSDGELVSNNEFKNIKVAEVLIDSRTFLDKYMVQVEQMSLTKKAFDFFRAIRDQRLGATSLFQPPYGEVKGNIKSVNSDEIIVGIFWATSIKTKVQFIERDEVPYAITEPDVIYNACTLFPNSSTHPPKLWQ